MKRISELDIIDMKIMGILLDNCRESNRQIGMKIGLTGVAISRRIQKMIDRGVIEKFSLKIDPPALGYHMVFVVVSSQDNDKILEQISLIGKPFILIPCIGGITVCGLAIKEDVENKIEIAKKLMRDIKILSINQVENQQVDAVLTRTDLEIISVLSEDPLAKIEEIAKVTGYSSKTITRTMEKLYETDGVQFTLTCNPKNMEKFIPYAILAGVKGNIKKILRNLEKEFSELFLQKPFIAKNQISLFMHSNDIFSIDDMTQKIRNLEGITSTELFIPKKVLYPTKWIQESIKDARKSPTLHLVYPVSK